MTQWKVKEERGLFLVFLVFFFFKGFLLHRSTQLVIPVLLSLAVSQISTCQQTNGRRLRATVPDKSFVVQGDRIKSILSWIIQKNNSQPNYIISLANLHPLAFSV